MRDQHQSDLWTLSDLCTPWCVHVVATLHIAEHLASGITQIDELAEAASAHPESLGRVLRHLVAKGLFEEPNPGRFILNDLARSLLTSSIGLDLDGIGGRMAYAWGSLLTAVRTGRPAYDRVFGRTFWEDLEANLSIAESFDALMGPEGHGIPDPEVLISGDWEWVREVVDVGGGTGALLAEILLSRPNLRGILVDLPSTVARSRKLLQTLGVADRITVTGQSFFDPLPARADLYLMKNVLGDWPNREALQLLSRCAEAARPNGRVVILGGVSPDGPTSPSPELLMMVLLGGKDRSLSQFIELARFAGLEVSKSGHLRSGRFVVECRAVN